MSFCKGEFNLFEHLFGFWKLPHLQGQLLLLLLPELYVFSANILILRFFDDISFFFIALRVGVFFLFYHIFLDDISSVKFLIPFLKFVQQFLLSSEFSRSILFLTSNNDLTELLLFL